MKKALNQIVCFCFLLVICSLSVYAQSPARQDLVWARTTTEIINLDGNLDEASWAKADSIHITFGQSSGIPTSGWSTDGFANPSGNHDSVHATLKFLAQNNQLYIAFIVPDSSIDGHDWPGPAWWDGVLMNVKDIRTVPVGREEIFPTFLFTDTTTGGGVGSGPLFGYHGKFRNQRTAAEAAKWDMGYMINGVSNDDSSSADKGYIFEMKINLDSLGYNTTQPGGGIVALNISIYDCDWYFQSNPLKRAVGRAYWQHAWSDQNDNVGRVMISPDVTIDSGPAPEVPPDVIVPNGAKDADPIIDADLSDPVWNGAYTFNIKYGDTTNIRSYPGVGKLMSAWTEIALNSSSLPEVLDPGDATVKIFFKDNYLYLAADVRDALIQENDLSPDMKDGVRFVLGLMDSTNLDNQMVFLNLLADFDTSGNPRGDEDLDTLIKQGAATLAMKMDGTLNDKSDIDVGYTVELKLDLTKLGYASDLGNHLLFGGVDLLDADSFDDPANDYGSRTWFYKPDKGGGPTAWMYMDPNIFTDVKDYQSAKLPGSIVLYGNYPNPFNPSTKLSYSIPHEGQVSLIIYNILGQQVSNINLLHQTSGLHVFNFNAGSLASGVYLYRIKLSGDKAQNFLSKTGKMVLLK
jgi:Secretion system C-terminal sorting domain